MDYKQNQFTFQVTFSLFVSVYFPHTMGLVWGVLLVHLKQHGATDGGGDADKLPSVPLRHHLTEILTTQRTETEICLHSE